MSTVGTGMLVVEVVGIGGIVVLLVIWTGSCIRQLDNCSEGFVTQRWWWRRRAVIHVYLC